MFKGNFLNSTDLEEISVNFLKISFNHVINRLFLVNRCIIYFYQSSYLPEIITIDQVSWGLLLFLKQFSSPLFVGYFRAEWKSEILQSQRCSAILFVASNQNSKAYSNRKAKVSVKPSEPESEKINFSQFSQNQSYSTDVSCNS